MKLQIYLENDKQNVQVESSIKANFEINFKIVMLHPHHQCVYKYYISH